MCAVSSLFTKASPHLAYIGYCIDMESHLFLGMQRVFLGAELSYCNYP